MQIKMNSNTKYNCCNRYLLQISISIFLAGHAYANDGILPTQLLNQGQMAMYVDSTANRQTNSITIPSITIDGQPLSGNQTYRQVSEYAEFRYAPIQNLQLSVGVPYNSTSSARMQLNDGENSFSHQFKGWNNTSFAARYAFLNSSDSPWKITATLSYVPDTAAVSTTAYNPSVAVSYQLSPDQYLFTTLSGYYWDNRVYQNSNTAQVGWRKNIGPNVTLISELSDEIYNNSDTVAKARTIGVTEILRFQINDRISIVPSVSYQKRSHDQSQGGDVIWGAASIKTASVAVVFGF